MKHLSIKARVTLWYTTFMLIFMAVAVFCLLLLSSRISQRHAREILSNVVTDAVRDVHFRYGELDTEDMDFYRDGVSIFIYDTSGYLLAPQINLGIQADSVLQDQVVRKVQTGGPQQMIYHLYAIQSGTPFWVRGVISLAEADLAFASIRYLVLLGMPLFILLAALGGFAVTRRAFVPVVQIVEAAEQINTGTDLSRRIPEGQRKDELSRLSRAINQMLSRLQESFDRERRFTSDVSHELRTPLSVIRSQCEYALSPESDCAQREEALGSILRHTRRMTDMVSQLLLLSRGENGTFQPNLTQVDLSRLISMTVMDLEPAAESAKLTVETEIQSDVSLSCDETLMSRLITNLLTNAIRYNRPGGRIQVSLKMTEVSNRESREGGMSQEQKADQEQHGAIPAAIIQVSDTGIGIPKEKLPKIWDRFYRADSSRSSEGTGLGLSMVRWIAQVHGGWVQAESTEGHGSVFTVYIPF